MYNDVAAAVMAALIVIAIRAWLPQTLRELGRMFLWMADLIERGMGGAG